MKQDSCFHLMSVISMLDHDLAIGFEKLFADVILKYNKDLKNSIVSRGLTL